MMEAVVGGDGRGEEADGLEIVSVGALYRDPWAKKYWSCSRGKDRYPYPVGYHALRTHAGCTYKMEIREDGKGPVFVITSIDKESLFGAGQTPDMAWEQFQKRSGPQVKLLHGKRCSGKADGVEFFGFRNPLVQRLLRELVANANGPAEQSLISPNPNNGASGSKHEVQLSESRRHLDFLSCIEGRKTGKRSRRHRTRTMSTTKGIISHESQIYCYDNTDAGEDENQLHTSFLKQNHLKEKGEYDSNILVSTGSPKLDGCFSENGGIQNESADKIADCEEQCTASSQLEGAVASDTPNSNSEKSDSDLIRQELAKSMMTVLLPQALPLLTKTYKRKRARPCGGEKSLGKNNTTHQHMDVKFQDKTDEVKRSTGEFITNEKIPGRTIRKDTSLVIPDSFEDDQFTNDTSIHQRHGNVMDNMGDIGDSSINQLRNEMTADVLHNEKAKMPFVSANEIGSFPFVSDTGSASLCEGVSLDDKLEIPICINDKTYLRQNYLPSHASGVQVPETNYIGPQISHNVPNTMVHDPINATDPENLDDLQLCATDKKAHNRDGKVDKFHSQQLETCLYPNSRNCGGLFSESIICRNTGQDAVGEACSSINVSHSTKIGQSVVADEELHRKILLTNEGEVDVENFNSIEGNPISENLVINVIPSVLRNSVKSGCLIECMSSASVAKDIEEDGSKNELVYPVELVGCCVHPASILSVSLSSKQECIHVCVLCGFLEGNERTLFLYAFPVNKFRGKAPTFLGYTSITIPCSRGIHEREAALWNSGLQFTPDGQHLVLINSFRAPRCREKNVNCLCFICASDNSEENALEVVHIELGYVSSLNKLETSENVHCILVCEPNYLVAAEESGKLQVWLMNMTWSESVEGFSLPSYDWAPMLELHTIPKSASLIVGHNGTGGFGLWDLSQRVLLAKYSASHHSFARVLPIGLCCCKITDCLGTSFEIDKIKEILADMEMSFCGSSAQCIRQTCGEDIAVWLLISAYPEEDINRDSGGSWRLALLAKNRVLMSKTLDPRASAVNVLGGKGIMGTSDGLVYMWELCTGRKLFNLHHNKGGSILHIAADAESGVLVVAGEDCKLCFYEQSLGQ